MTNPNILTHNIHTLSFESEAVEYHSSREIGNYRVSVFVRGKYLPFMYQNKVEFDGTTIAFVSLLQMLMNVQATPASMVGLVQTVSMAIRAHAGVPT